MNSLFTRASHKRSARNRVRKNSISMDTDIVCSPRKTRPPPLQIIPELLESELEIDISSPYSPTTARPNQFFLQQSEPKMSRITLSAYAFSIDDTLMLANRAPRSPALSASSSTSESTSSDVPTTPRTFEGQEEYHIMVHTPRFCPRTVSIRPLCIVKPRSLVCQEGEDTGDHFEKDLEDEKTIPSPITEERLAEARAVTEAIEEAEQDFYIREFGDFISLSPVVPSPSFPARRDSLTLTAVASPNIIDVPGPKPRGRSRHSKPLPLLPPATPPVSSFPPILILPVAQTIAQESVVRRKRNVPDSQPSSPESRPPPRTAVPLDIDDCILPEDNFDVPPRRPTAIKDISGIEEDTSVYSRPSFAYTVSANTCLLSPATPETPFFGMYDEVTLPRSSTDTDPPRSSTDSCSSFVSSTFSNTPVSPFNFPDSPSPEGPEFESSQRLRSRWSSSTLASLVVEPPRTVTLFSPLKSVLGSRARWALLPPQKVAPQSPPRPKPSKHKHGFLKTPLPLGTVSKPIRRQGSQSSTSSKGTSSSERNGHNGSPSGLKRKPIPVSMFLRSA